MFEKFVVVAAIASAVVVVGVEVGRVTTCREI